MEPSTVYQVTGEFLADHPGSEDALQELLTLDEHNQTWAFNQVTFDSGRFGELVSRGIVESVGEEYQIAHREAVRTALAGERFEPARSDSEPAFSTSVESLSVDFGAVAGLVVALVVIIIGRAWTYSSVVREDYLISPANDPYFYRYWQAELLEMSTGVTDTSVVTSLPGGARSRPYTHVVNWWLTELLGGTQSSADLVAAWLPVIGAAALGVVLYFTVITLTDDIRIAVVAVTLLGVMPVHAVYTSLGFLEHRLHQYFWLGVIVFTLTWLAKHSGQLARADGERDGIHEHLSSSNTWAVALLLMIAVAITPYPWRGSTLIFGPVALYLGIRVLTDVRQGVSPVLANLPTTIAVTVGGVVALYPHLRWGWHESTAFLAYTPLLVAAGTVAVVSLGEFWRRLKFRASILVVMETLAAAGIAWAFTQLRPDQVTQIQSRVDALLFRENIAEVISLFAADWNVVFGPIFQLGIVFYLAVVPLGWVSWVLVREYRPEWLVPVVFGWYFLILATVQVRFAAHFSIFVSIFGAVSIIYILATVDLIRQPDMFSSADETRESANERTLVSGGSNEDRVQSDISRFRTEPRRVVYTLGIVMLILSLNLAFTPGLIDQTTYSNAEIEAMTEIQTHADNTDRQYPEARVLSQWGQSRMYNYFLSGESQGYGFARSNYEPFITAPNPDEQYRQLGGQTGYVVVTETAAPSNTTQTRLYRDFGAGEEPAAHYRLLYAGDGVRAFALVKGAVIQIENVSADRVRISTDVQTTGQQFEYSQSTTPNESGTVTVRVAYPGEYQIGNRTITVSDSAVHDGKTVSE